MIARGDAVAFCAAHFPRGPEALAEHLGVIVRASPLVGCDGWCLWAAKSVIHLNSRKSKGRQRFTLAHELSHLILGTEGEVVGSGSGPYQAESQEETQANQLAAELLLPVRELRGMGLCSPVDPLSLGRIARAAGVTQVMAACRIATLAPELRLENATVLGFQSGKLVWRWSKTLSLPDDDSAVSLYQNALRSASSVYRGPQADGQVFCASVIKTQGFHALFVQLLPAKVAERKTADERRRELEAWLFGEDAAFRNSVNGQFSSFLKRAQREEMGVDGATDSFYEAYGSRWEEARARKMHSDWGREWVRLKFAMKLGTGG